MKNYYRIFHLMLITFALWQVSGSKAYSEGTSIPKETAFVQSSPAQGVVLDEKGEPIIGATVQVKGTANGTQTNLDGRFNLTNVKKGDILLVKFVGYQDLEVAWNGKDLTIRMREDTTLLDEVVVVGYASQKVVNVTGSVSSIDSKSLETRPVQNVAQALQGQVPGLNMSVGNGGGALNSDLYFNIRGGGTIGQGSSGAPLVLIDGIEGNMNTVNPNDIESVSVLKDAASSSIYGARAAFGVILITTKRGRSGKTRVSYTGNVRFNKATQRPKMMNSIDFANYFNEAQKNYNGTAIFTDEVIEKMKKWQNGEYTDPDTPEYYGTSVNPTNGMYKAYGDAFANTDWFREFYRDNVPSQEHNISLSGGNEKITYLVSGSILDQNGLLRHGKDKFRRLTLNSKFSTQLAEWLTMNISNKWTRENYSRPQYLEIGGLFYHNIARRWPTNPSRVPGGYNMHWMEMDELDYGGVMTNEENWLTNQIQFVFEPITDWHITLDGSLRQYYTKYHKYVLPVYSHGPNGVTKLEPVGWTAPGYTMAENTRKSEDYYSVNAFTDYSKTIEGHYFKVLLGFNAELYQAGNLWGKGEDLISPLVPQLSTTQKNFKTSNSETEFALAGFFGRLNYNYKERYMLEANLRYDGSSRFVGDKRWGLFPSFSAGWNIANEDFFESTRKHVNSLKIRASWGRLGNNEVDSYYPFYQSMPTGAENSSWLINGNFLNTASIPRIVSNALTWETVESWDIGVDFGLLNNRLRGSFDYYNRYTYNMVGPAKVLPEILGATPPAINNADLKSYGWEMELSWRDQYKDLSYGARMTLSDGKRKILRYPNPTGNIYTYYEGKILGEIWGFETVGIAQTQEEMDDHLKNNRPNWGSNWAPGDIMYKDLNNDGEVTSGSGTLSSLGDLIRIGNSTPRYNFGLSVDAAWKGIDFTLFLQGVLKRDYMFGQGEPYFWGAVGDEWQSAGFVEHADYWSPTNRDAYYPRPIFHQGSKNQVAQTRYLQNASYMRIKNIQLGYSLPQAWTTKAGITRLRLYVSADNLATFTKINKVYDPEALGGSYGAGKLYPLQRSISLGVNINF